MKTDKLKRLLWILASVLPPAMAYAGDETNPPQYRPVSLSLEAGTTGAGGSVAFRFLDHLGVRGGFDYFTYSGSHTFEGIPYDSTVRPMSEVLTLNIYPWTKHSFYISAGALFNQNQLTGSASDANGITLDGTFYPPGQVGTLHLKIDQLPVNPYLSIGGNFFYFDRAHHWSMGGELGVAYTGEPQVSLTRSGGVPSSTIDAAVKQTQQQIANNARPFQVWPVLKLQVTYSF